MVKTNSFKEVRRDGRIIDETMTVQDVIDKGWGVEPIIEIRWEFESGHQKIRNPEGILAEVLPDQSGIVGLFSMQGKDVLKVFNSDGSERLEVPSTQMVAGDMTSGSYEWFEPPTVQDGSCFGVIFNSEASGLLYQLDIDSQTGTVVSEKLSK